MVRALLEMEAAVTPQLKVRILLRGRRLHDRGGAGRASPAFVLSLALQADAAAWALVEPLAEEVEVLRLMMG